VFRRSLNSQTGSAILEFIAFVLVGQLLIFGASIAMANELTKQVENQVEASNAAKSVASASDQLQDECAGPLACIRLTKDGHDYLGLSYR
jgi:hypothetical protein